MFCFLMLWDVIPWFGHIGSLSFISFLDELWDAFFQTRPGKTYDHGRACATHMEILFQPTRSALSVCVDLSFFP